MKQTPIKIFVDTDFGNVYDDIGALAVLHSLKNKGEAEIIGMTTCVGAPYSAGALDVVNTFYGCSDIPLGAVHDLNLWPDMDRYSKELVELFPSKIKRNTEAMNSVTLMRKVFSNQPDNSVILVALGATNNLANLLKSQKDEYSDKDGIELVETKVKKLCIMGGSFDDETTCRIDNPNNVSKGWTYNWSYYSPMDSKYVFENWPTQVDITTSEAGYIIRTGELIYKDCFNENPVRLAYEIYDKKKERGHTIDGAWDQMTILQAVRDYGKYYDIVDNGSCECDDNGCSIWNTDKKKDHRFGIINKEYAEELSYLLDDLMVEGLKNK
ncbi:nucleoside hydrolase [Vallitalea sediminicola]